MADDVIFEKEDRVKVISGKLKGNKGYVRYVGPVEGKEDAIYVGVELDEPNGKHDGKAKGKRYFKCRYKHGYMAPFDTFELFGKSKKKLRRISKPKSSLKLKLKSKSNSISPNGDSKPKGKKLRKRKSLKNSKKIDTSTPVATPKGDTSKLSVAFDDMPPSKSPTPIVTQITYSDACVQTEMTLHIVSDRNDIASVSKEVAQAHASMIESLRAQITKLQSEIAGNNLKNLRLENDLLSKNDLIEIVTIEKEAMAEEIEDMRQEISENELIIANLELDIEELKDSKMGIRESVVCELEFGQKNINDILLQNETLRETMDALKKTCVKEMSDKNAEILQLSLQCKGIRHLTAHISELQKQLELKQSIETECREFKRELDLRADSDRIIEVLSTKNVELEWEAKRLSEVNKHNENMGDIYSEMERENEQFIFDLNEELKGKDVLCAELEAKYDKAHKELRHSQQKVQSFKEYIRKLEETKRKMNASLGRNSDSKKNLKLENQLLLRCNLELLDRINGMKQTMIEYSTVASKGMSDSISQMILALHIPAQIKCDFGAIQFLGFLERISFKNRFAIRILDAFYINHSQSEMGDDISQYLAENDIKDTFAVIELCPILVKHDRFIDCILQALITCHSERFNECVSEWSHLLAIEAKYNALLTAVKNNNIRGGEVSISDIFKCNDLFRTYLNKYFVGFNPETKLRAHEKIDKWALFTVMATLKYSLYSMQLKTRQINDLLMSANDDERDESKREYVIGVLQKMEELQSLLQSIVKKTLALCVPKRCNIMAMQATNYNLAALSNDNYIGVEFDFIERTAQMMRALTTKQNLLMESLSTVFDETELTHFDKVGKVNRLLDEQSELSESGIIAGLTVLYAHIKALPYALEQFVSENFNAIATEESINPININVSTPWNEKARVIREELEQADIIRDALESAQAEIKYKQKELSNEKANTQRIRSILAVVKLELAKQHTINRDLVHFELESREADQKLQTFVAKNQRLKSENISLEKVKTELENKLNSYQNTLKSMKLKSNQRKIKHLHDTDRDYELSEHISLKSLKNKHSSLAQSHSLPRQSRGRGSHKPLNGLKDSARFIGLGDAATHSFDAYDTGNNHENDRMIIAQLNKELDLNRNYNRLLQKTISSLRHNHNIYNLHNSYLEMKRDLQPLPHFQSVNQRQYKNYRNKKAILKNKQKCLKLLADKERKKLLFTKIEKTERESKESESEEMETDLSLSSLKQRELKTKQYLQMQKALFSVDRQFSKVYASPHIVDLHRNNTIYKQEIIGRNLKLRNLKMQCCKLSKQCQEIESTFQSHTNDNNSNIERSDGSVSNNHSNLSMIGRIDIEGIKSNHKNQNTKVRLNRNNIVKLQSYLNVL